MGTKVVKEIIEKTDHPLEDFFNIEPNTTEVVKYEQTTELVAYEEYDEKDGEIENDFQEVYDKAMSGYEVIQEAIEDVEPKLISRMQEVANQILNTALSAAAHKADLKKHKDKMSVAVKAKDDGSGTKAVLIDTNTLIQQLRKARDSDIIDASPVIDDDKNK